MPEITSTAQTQIGPAPPFRVDALSYRYPGGSGLAIADASLEIAEGELVVLAGATGSGKSTLLRAGCGLVPHLDGGEVSGGVEVGGLSVREHGPAELAPLVGYLAQDPETQVVSTTVRAELALPLELRGVGAGERARAVEEVALALAIPALLDRTTESLSGGELQRTALAAALIGRPPLALLDEPTSQLDPVAGEELIWLLRRLNQEWGTAAVIAEHRLDRCLAAADRVVALEAGRISFDGTPGDYLEWALDSAPDLATSLGRMFDLAGIRPAPTGVKQARRALRERTAISGSTAAVSRPHPSPVVRSGPPVIEARGIWARHPGEPPIEALRGVDLQVAAGERIALIGRNGAGKSTLLALIAGLIDPWRGRIAAPGGLALLTQSPADFLVRERVADELPGEAGRTALRAVGLEWAVDRDPRDLSGGERQRLALAIVMAGRGLGGDPPAAIALDEPTRGMDAARRRDLAELVERLARGGTAVLLATHDVELAAELCERVVLIAEGRVIADGSTRELLSGGWYFSTQVGRALDGAAATVSEGAALLATPEGERR